MTENPGFNNTLKRRETRRKILGIAGKTILGGLGLWKGTELVGAGIYAARNALEQSQTNTTEAQKKAVEEFNKLEEQIKQNPELKKQIAYSLRTGLNGAVMRSIPKPLTSNTPDENNFESEPWKPHTTYPIPNGAILVAGGDPSGLKRQKADWYFIATQRDAKTNKITGGYFSYAGNFVPIATAAQTK